MDVSLVVPIFNEAECIGELYGQISRVLARLERTVEVIFVDDGSTDDSAAILDALADKDPRVTVAHFRRNCGKSAALDFAFRVARGEIVITMDADLQDDPAEIPMFIAAFAEGYDVVNGWKQKRQDPIGKTMPYQGADIKLDDLGLDVLKDGTAFTSLSYSGSRAAEFSDATVSVVFDVGRAKYFFPGFALRLLLRLGSATETTSRLTRAFIDRYRRRAKTAINQSSASVQTGGAGFRLTRSVAVDANLIVVTDSLAADDGATIELRLRPMPADQKKHYSTEPGGSLTIRKTVDLATGTLLVEAA